MNPLLVASEREAISPEPKFGSGRFYARLSQTEFVSDKEFAGPRVWIFEAFDAEWFDANPPGGNWIRYFDDAQIFILEMHIQPGEERLHHALETVDKADYEQMEPEEWFALYVSPIGSRPVQHENEILVVVYSNLYGAGIRATLSKADHASEKQSQLSFATSTAHIPDASEADLDGALSGLANVDWAVVYDVGQGNSIGFCNQSASVQAYFDFGGGVLANKRTFPAALTSFCFSKPPPVILSHWDFDHWSSSSRDLRSLASTWIAPRQTVGPTHVALMAQIRSSGTLLLVPNTFAAKWRGQIYLEGCTGRGRNHSGIALTLSEHSFGGGNQMLFPGDARYNCIPSFSASKDYLSVVAPHHGADMRNHIVPSGLSASCSRLAYSFGAGNTFSHPRAVTRTDHDANGWRDPTLRPMPPHEVRETVHRGRTGVGHVLLGWTTRTSAPALPCGTRCQLEAQQL